MSEFILSSIIEELEQENNKLSNTDLSKINKDVNQASEKDSENEPEIKEELNGQEFQEETEDQIVEISDEDIIGEEVNLVQVNLDLIKDYLDQLVTFTYQMNEELKEIKIALGGKPSNKPFAADQYQQFVTQPSHPPMSLVNETSINSSGLTNLSNLALTPMDLINANNSTSVMRERAEQSPNNAHNQNLAIAGLNQDAAFASLDGGSPQSTEDISLSPSFNTKDPNVRKKLLALNSQVGVKVPDPSELASRKPSTQTPQKSGAFREDWYYHSGKVNI